MLSTLILVYHKMNKEIIETLHFGYVLLGRFKLTSLNLPDAASK